MVAVARANILAKQGGKCAICEVNIVKEHKQPTLDHDHNTGICRGVLCNNCNGIEGKVNNLANRAKRDGTPREWLVKLLKYLDHHDTNRTSMIHPTHKSDEEKRVLKNARARKARATARKKVAPK